MDKPPRFNRFIFLFHKTSLLLLAGCTFGNQLYVGNATVIGLKASVNTARTAGSIDVGYDRYFVTWVPKSVDKMESASASKQTDRLNKPIGPATSAASGAQRDVMSVLACSDVRIGILSLKRFDESLATGRAATILAKNLKDKEKLFRCYSAPDDPKMSRSE